MPQSDENWNFGGEVRIQPGSLLPARPRSEFEQTVLASELIPWESWRVWDALQTNLPGAGASDDLGLIGGAFGTGTPSLQTGDLKTAGATNRYARCIRQIRAEYDEGETALLRFHAGMITHIADVTATLDVEVFKSNKEAGLTGIDLITTNAQDINSLTYANFDFVINPASLLPGDILDIRIKIAVNDAASLTAVIGAIGSAEMLLDIKG